KDGGSPLTRDPSSRASNPRRHIRLPPSDSNSGVTRVVRQSPRSQSLFERSGLASCSMVLSSSGHPTNANDRLALLAKRLDVGRLGFALVAVLVPSPIHDLALGLHLNRR